MPPLLSIAGLSASFQTYAGEVQAVRGIDLDVAEGEVLAIVGESGSGKSVSMLSVMRLLPSNARIRGQVLFDGRDLLSLSDNQMNRIRGREIGMVFQDPMTGLNPTLAVGVQITESLEYHLDLSRSAARARAVELLQWVGVPEAEKRLGQFPHQFSGGMRQRVMIAIALACSPKLIIADEPTTALDVTIQAQILDLLKRLQRETAATVILITHNLGVVAGIANRVAVMYGGRVVELGAVRDIYHNPRHPYTWALLRAVPRLDQRRERLESIAGSPPNMLQPPPGCAYHPRCPHAMQICAEEAPGLMAISGRHGSACWLEHPDAPKPQSPEEVAG